MSNNLFNFNYMKNPAKNKIHRIGVRLDAKEYEELKTISKETNLTITKIVRTAVNDYSKIMKKKRNP